MYQLVSFSQSYQDLTVFTFFTVNGQLFQYRTMGNRMTKCGNPVPYVPTDRDVMLPFDTLEELFKAAQLGAEIPIRKLNELLAASVNDLD